MQCSDNRGACRHCYGVQGYETRGGGGMPPQGKFECLGEIMHAFDAIFDHSKPIFTLK